MTLCYQHPTSIVVLDDDFGFLKTLKSNLGIGNIEVMTSATDFLQRYETESNPFDRIKKNIFASKIEASETSFLGEYNAPVKIQNLHKEIYNQSHKNDISVFIIDYQLDDCNGIHLCEKLSQHPAKKILLTGNLNTEKFVIDAFNKGIINSFISKGSETFPVELKSAIFDLKNKYFEDLSNKILSVLPSELTTLICSPAYRNFISTIKSELESVEHYLLDFSGSVLFTGKNKDLAWLIIKNQKELSEYSHLAEMSEENGNIGSRIKSYKEIPFFFSERDLNQPVEAWEKFLYPAKKIPNLRGYYYSLVQGNINNNINMKKLYG